MTRRRKTTAINASERTRRAADNLAARLGHAGDRRAEQVIRDLIRSHDGQRGYITQLANTLRAKS